MMKHARPHRFPPLSQVSLAAPGAGPASVQLQASLADGFREGLDKGYRDGQESGRQEGHAEGLRAGHRAGVAEGRREALARFDAVAPAMDALVEAFERFQGDYQSALRKEVVDLVAKVARQVIRCELALQPVQLLSLVDETLAAMPRGTEEVEVLLNPEELQRIRELDPVRASRWRLVPDATLEPGECRVRAGAREADAGCRQRLAACMERVSAQLSDTAPTTGTADAAAALPVPPVADAADTTTEVPA
jgi:flagellar assembly protein FliH